MQITPETLSKVRKVYRLTQAEIGALCDVSDAYINMIERGKRPVSDRLRNKLIDELAMTPDKLARILENYEETELPKMGTS